MFDHYKATKEEIVALAAMLAVMAVLIFIAIEVRGYMERRKRK